MVILYVAHPPYEHSEMNLIERIAYFSQFVKNGPSLTKFMVENSFGLFREESIFSISLWTFTL